MIALPSKIIDLVRSAGCQPTAKSSRSTFSLADIRGCQLQTFRIT